MTISNNELLLSPKLIWEQHNELENIVSEIINMKSIGINNQLLISKVIKLEEFITKLFLYGEDLMVKYSLPWMEVHKQQHNYLRAKLEEFNLYNFTTPMDYFEEALNFMVELLSTHMMKEDVNLAKYISQRIILAEE